MSNITRRSFKCRFNDYITPDNRDSVILSLIKQFEGLYADPEVTVNEDNTFVISLLVNKELTPTLVRDKLLWNGFIKSVTAGDSIRKLKRLSLPQVNALQQGLGTGQLDGIEPDTGVSEVLTQNTKEDGEKQVPQMEYKIDNADRPDGPPVRKRSPAAVLGLGMSKSLSSIHTADPGSLRNEGQAFTHEPDDVIGPQDLDSKATEVDKFPKVFATRYATEGGTGGSQFAQPFDQKTKMDSVDNAPLPTRGPKGWDKPGQGKTLDNTGTGLDSATNSWFSEIGEESTIPKKNETHLIGTGVSIGSLKGIPIEKEEPKSGQELPGANQMGTGNLDDGEQIMGDSWGNRFCSVDFDDTRDEYMDNSTPYYDEGY